MGKLAILACAGCFTCLSAFGAIDLKECKFTQVVNAVDVISTSDNSKHAAAVDEPFKMPDVLRTGAASRAELVAPDRTITRVGANTIFSFDAADRTINLQQGSLLFNAPKGKGGGSIHTAAATAAVLGTTLIVTTTTNGGFKVLDLEGTVETRFRNGLHQTLHAGQLTYVLPGGAPGPIVSFRLDQLVAGSKLVSGFSKPLQSLPIINAEVAQQIHQIQTGRAVDTGMLAGNMATATGIQVIDPINYVNGGITPEEFNPSGGPPPTITPTGNGFLNPDGFLFTSSTSDTLPVQYAEGPATATLSDAVINNPTLDSSRVFTGSVMVTSADFPGLSSLPQGFFARNVSITTSAIDFSPYAGLTLQDFTFFASEDLNIANSLALSTYATEIVFFAGKQLSIAPGVTITGNAPSLEFDSTAAMNLNSVNIMNTGGGVLLQSFAAISLNNVSLGSSGGYPSVTIADYYGTTGNISLQNTLINAENISISSGGTLSLSGTTPAAGQLTSPSGADISNPSPLALFVNISLSAATGLNVGVNLSADPQTGSIILYNGSGLMTVNNGAQLTAGNIYLQSGDGILVDSIAPVKAKGMVITAGNGPNDAATVQNTDLSNLSALNVNAQTIVLMNVALPNSGNTVFAPANGVLAPNPNTSQSIVPGDLNFIRNVTYQGALANTPGVGYTVIHP